MAKGLTDDCRRMEIRQLPKGEGRAVLRWTDAEGRLEARAVVSLEGESAEVAYDWREGEGWQSRRFEVALHRARPHAGGWLSTGFEY